MGRFVETRRGDAGTTALADTLGADDAFLKCQGSRGLRTPTASPALTQFAAAPVHYLDAAPFELSTRSLTD
jgi:hypothetical protein